MMLSWCPIYLVFVLMASGGMGTEAQVWRAEDLLRSVRKPISYEKILAYQSKRANRFRLALLRFQVVGYQTANGDYAISKRVRSSTACSCGKGQEA